MRKYSNEETPISIFFPKKSPTLHGNGGGHNFPRPGASGGSKENLPSDNSKNLIGDGGSNGTGNNAGDASSIGKSGSAAGNPSGGNSGLNGSSGSSNMGPGGADQAAGNPNGANSNENSAATTGALTDSAGNFMSIQI
jgi:hypothetical protein